MDESTVYRWLHNARFMEAYRRARRSVMEQGVAQLQGLVGDAVAALKRSLACGHAGSEIRAAVAVFELAFQGVMSHDLEAEIFELKQGQQEMKQQIKEKQGDQ